MQQETLGAMIAVLRKEKGMTQSDLAKKMGVTDKAVSKCERDLSCPDVNSLPVLSEILGVTVGELINVKLNNKNIEKNREIESVLRLILKIIPFAMAISIVVLSVLERIDLYSGFSMLGIGLLCLSVLHFLKK